jgi:hypothetical protein
MEILAQRQPQQPYEEAPKARETAKVAAGGSVAGAIAGLGALVLCILGLLGMYPLFLLSIAVIAAGVAFCFEGAALYGHLYAISRQRWGARDVSDVGGNMSAEFVSGIAGIVLGILALIGFSPLILISIAAIVLGTGLVIGSSMSARLSALSATYDTDAEPWNEIVRESSNSGAGSHVLIGLGAITLGIIALTGLIPLTLSLIAFLSLGFAGLVGGTALGGRMVKIFHR